MSGDRRWTDADRELVARAVHDHACIGDDCSWSEEPRACDLAEFTGFGDAVLDALTATGWLAPDQRATREQAEIALDAVRRQVREQVAQEIAGDLDAWQAAVLRARIAAAVATLEQTRDAAHSHYRGCWQHHADCLADRLRRQLNGEAVADA